MNNINSIPLGQLHWQQLKFLHFRRETTTNNNNKIYYYLYSTKCFLSEVGTTYPKNAL